MVTHHLLPILGMALPLELQAQAHQPGQVTRVSASAWLETLYPRGGGRDTVVYRMRRVGPPRP